MRSLSMRCSHINSIENIGAEQLYLDVVVEVTTFPDVTQNREERILQKLANLTKVWLTNHKIPVSH